MHCVVKLKLVLKDWRAFIVLNIKQISYLSRMVPFACVILNVLCST